MINSIPGLIILGFSSYSLGKHALYDGSVVKRDSLSFDIGFNILHILLLYSGGFFASCHWPQIVWFILLGTGCATLFDRDSVRKYNFLSNAISQGIIWFIYIKGGLIIGW